MRRCASCGTDHHPRTDPVVIMLVTDGDRVLLGRQPTWPAGRYSALAGFVEPGESLEEAVAREVREEAGVEVGPPEYVASQPWPFPSSLMLGFTVPWVSGEPRRIDEELEDVRWFDRADVAAAVEEREACSGSRRGSRSRGGCWRHGSGASLRVGVTLEGWIFMVGLRVFDVGALIVWLIWFFRLRDDDDDADDGRGGGGNARSPIRPRARPGGLRLPLPDAAPWPTRRRDHGGELRPAPAPAARGVPEPVPARAPVKRR